MIKIIDLCKTYGAGTAKTEALKNINLEIPDHEFVSILGKSGSGKTTLLNLIGSLDISTSGSIYINDVNLMELNKKETALFRNQNIGFIFQSFYLESKFTVLENTCMPLTIAGVCRKEREEKAKKILIDLGLEEKINKKVSELSGGEKQRVAVARALISDPPIILADEPTGNLDNANGSEIMHMLKELAIKGKTVILVTHNEDYAKMADRIITISDGLIVQDVKREVSNEV